MSITSSKIEVTPDEGIQYPLLMVNRITGDIWLCQAPKQGTLLQTNHGIVGGNSVRLVMDDMKKFHGNVTLSQD